MNNPSEKPFVNYFAMPLDSVASVLAIEVFDGDRLVDVELLTPYRANPSDCNAAAVAENLAAVKRGDHVSQYRAAQEVRAVA